MPLSITQLDGQLLQIRTAIETIRVQYDKVTPGVRADLLTQLLDLRELRYTVRKAKATLVASYANPLI